LAQAASLLSEPARQKGLQLFVDARSLPANLLGDPVRLNQALLNYANNAIKFTERGSVTLAAEVVEDGDEYVLIRFEVRDTGVGFASEDAERLFEAFEQADNSVSRRYGGTGLGLAITRRLARLMGGDAGAAPNPGGGSTFWFTARLRRGPPGMVPGEAEEESVEAALRREGAGRRVLLVEDEPINAEVATELLQSVGLEVVSAADGVEALAMAAVGRFDLVLMDLQMPRMDGFETTRRIRSLPNRGRMPIVAMTANAFTEDRARCLEAGMDDFVAKPVDPPALYAAVRRWLVRPRF
ncbi:MAG TPA: response regulator, partial [Rhodocyclaceae bacterium]|nr:response regulator [Rhodocyclaceae bacterium]